MTDNVLALSSAAMAATQAAAEQFQLAAAAQSARGYRLLYIAQSGCGSSHSYGNLNKAQQSLGVTLQYANFSYSGFGSDFVEKGVRAPGHSLRAKSYDQAQRYVNSKGLEVYDTSKAVLLDANDNVVHKFESTKGQEFLLELKRYLPSAQTPARGAVRS